MASFARLLPAAGACTRDAPPADGEAAAADDGGVSDFDLRGMRVLGTCTTRSGITVSGGRIVVQGGRPRRYANRVRVRP